MAKRYGHRVTPGGHVPSFVALYDRTPPAMRRFRPGSSRRSAVRTDGREGLCRSCATWPLLNGSLRYTQPPSWLAASFACLRASSSPGKRDSTFASDGYRMMLEGSGELIDPIS